MTPSTSVLACVVAVALLLGGGCGQDEGGDDRAIGDDATSSTRAATSTGNSTSTSDDAGAGEDAIAPFDRGGAELTAPGGTVTCVCVLVADTRAERSQGLMNRTDLGDDAGMVFVFETDSTAAFTMRDTPLPLSIAWYRADGTLVSTTDMDPCLDGGDCPTYRAGGPYRYALEVPRGELGAVGATDDATFALVDECA